MTEMVSDPHVVWLTECTGDRARLVGGKATGLGALLREGLSVPSGFAITTAAYREHVAHAAVSGEIQKLLSDCRTFEAQQRASDEIRALIEASRPPAAVEDAVLGAHATLCSDGNTPVAVRSSATAEDTGAASFAGQQDTYLWILGGEAVLHHVVRCWSSLFTPHAIAYRAQMDTPVEDLAMGVVVQHMVPAEAAGVMLTIDPITGDGSGIVIEGAYGLGAAVVNGEVDPDRFCVDKNGLTIRSRATGVKTIAYRFDPGVQGTLPREVPNHLQTQPCVTDDEVRQLASLGKHMEQAMGRPQDIEWAIGPRRELFLLQSRPETVWSQKVQA